MKDKHFLALMMGGGHYINQCQLYLIICFNRDATTNPSLILAAAKMPQYSSIVDKAINDAKAGATIDEQVCSTSVERSKTFHSHVKTCRFRNLKIVVYRRSRFISTNESARSMTKAC